jgi:nitroreductase
MNVYETTIKRRSIRKYKDDPVPYKVLEKCVESARLAPAGGNRQLLEHVIVDDPSLRQEMFETVGRWAGDARPAGGWTLGSLPTAYIITLINLELEKELNAARRTTTCDVGMAAENMILVAWEEGIGSCAVLSFREKELKELLNIPEKYEVGMVLALGYPDENPVTEESEGSVAYWLDDRGVRHVPKRKLKTILHRNKFPK